MIFKVMFRVGPFHTHCRLFSAKREGETWQKLGEFTVHTGIEAHQLRVAMSGIPFREETYYGETASESAAEERERAVERPPTADQREWLERSCGRCSPGPEWEWERQRDGFEGG